MAFWAFGHAAEGGVDSRLDKWNPDSDDAGGSGISQATASSSKHNKRASDGALNSSPSIGIAEDDAPEASTSNQLEPLTLEKLLEEDDLLQELKNGHAKLVRSQSTCESAAEVADLIFYARRCQYLSCNIHSSTFCLCHPQSNVYSTTCQEKHSQASRYLYRRL